MWYDKDTQSVQHADKYSQHSSISYSVWLNGWVFIYDLCSCGFESRGSHLKTHILYADAEKCLDKVWLKDSVLET